MSVVDCDIDPIDLTPKQQAKADMAGALDSLADDLTNCCTDSTVRFQMGRLHDNWGAFHSEIVVDMDHAGESLADQLVMMLACLKANGIEPCGAAKKLLATVASF